MGPAVQAADCLYRREYGKPHKGVNLQRLAVMISCLLEGDAPMRFDFAAQAEELDTSVEKLRAQVAWLVERAFLVLDGDVDGVARLWVNPALAFMPGTDPRPAAARHQLQSNSATMPSHPGVPSATPRPPSRAGTETTWPNERSAMGGRCCPAEEGSCTGDGGNEPMKIEASRC